MIITRTLLTSRHAAAFLRRRLLSGERQTSLSVRPSVRPSTTRARRVRLGLSSAGTTVEGGRGTSRSGSVISARFEIFHASNGHSRARAAAAVDQLLSSSVFAAVAAERVVARARRRRRAGVGKPTLGRPLSAGQTRRRRAVFAISPRPDRTVRRRRSRQIARGRRVSSRPVRANRFRRRRFLFSTAVPITLCAAAASRPDRDD